MGSGNDGLFDENEQERPLGLASGSDKKQKSNSAVESLTGSNSRNVDNKDDAQHMKNLRNGLILVAGINSAARHHRKKVYTRISNKVSELDEKVKREHSAPGASGSYGRSIAEIYAEAQMNDAKKKMEKMQRKHPDLQRQMPVNPVRTIFSGLNSALRAQTMKGAVQATGGSDARAMAAASVAGYVPGADVIQASDDYSL